jgi:SAM-dependent methyltransferase
VTEDNELDNIRQEAARPYGVPPDVHHDDMIWRFIANHRNYPTPEAAAQYYFGDGAESARRLETIIQAHLPSLATNHNVSILEFASGYGMVTRHLAKLPNLATLLACDIHAEAVDFIRDRLNQRAIISRHNPTEMSFAEATDVVFALSFFSHMPESTFGGWLDVLFAAVKPGGILVFTTHGLVSRAHFGDITMNERGFWFRPSSEQSDLDTNEYGSSVATPAYVVNQLSHLAGASLAEFRRGFWWGHQDLYVVSRPT